MHKHRNVRYGFARRGADYQANVVVSSLQKPGLQVQNGSRENGREKHDLAFRFCLVHQRVDVVMVSAVKKPIETVNEEELYVMERYSFVPQRAEQIGESCDQDVGFLVASMPVCIASAQKSDIEGSTPL